MVLRTFGAWKVNLDTPNRELRHISRLVLDIYDRIYVKGYYLRFNSSIQQSKQYSCELNFLEDNFKFNYNILMNSSSLKDIENKKFYNGYH